MNLVNSISDHFVGNDDISQEEGRAFVALKLAPLLEALQRIADADHCAKYSFHSGQCPTCVSRAALTGIASPHESEPSKYQLIALIIELWCCIETAREMSASFRSEHSEQRARKVLKEFFATHKQF